MPGRIVGFDPEMDLAYLAVDGLPGLPFSVSSDGVESGDDGVAYVVRDGIIVELPVTVTRRVNIRTEDVYAEGETLRPGFELDARVQLGDSGGAIVIDGRLAAVVWSRSRRTNDRSWAIDPARGRRPDRRPAAKRCDRRRHRPHPLPLNSGTGHSCRDQPDEPQPAAPTLA